LQIVRGVKDDTKVTIPGSPAAKAGFKSGDKVVGVRPKGAASFTPLTNGWELIQAEERWRKETLEYQVKHDDAERIVTVEPAHFRTFGISLEMGPIRTVPRNDFAPKVAREFQVGDVIVAVNEEREFDPVRLPDMLRELADGGNDPVVTVRRDKEEKKIIIPHNDIANRDCWVEFPPSRTLASMGLPGLGLSYDILPKIARIQPGSSAAESGLQPGDEITQVTLYARSDKETIKFRMPKDNWSFAFYLFQVSDAENKVDVVYRRQGEEKTATLASRPDETWPMPIRGYRVEIESTTFRADSFSKAVQLGFRETYRFIVRMYLILKSLLVGDVSWANASGPVGIVTLTYQTAEQGFTDLILLLGIISINLAVVNFLPIPILDGGHMVFLLWEKIRGRPAGERAMAIANTVGLLVIVSLMVFVLFLDLGGRKLLFGD
jgi:regulator of sigma E protease